MTFYFVETPADGGGRSHVQEFLPAKSVKRSEEMYFGGWVVDVADNRTLAQLRKEQKVVLGLHLLEGGHGRLAIATKELYATRRQEAEAVAALLNCKK